jgi:O-antigen/teichoic acid export membrane protein
MRPAAVAGTDARATPHTGAGRFRAAANSLTILPMSRIARLGRALDDRSRRIALSALAGAAQRFAAMIGTFMMFPRVLHALGTDLFGVWGAAISLVMMITVADFGIGPAIVTLVSHALASKESEDSRDYLTAALITSCGIAVCFLIGGILLATSIAPRPMLSVYLLAVVGVAINVPLGAASAAWLALQRGWMVAFWDFLQTMFFIASVALALTFTKDIRLYVLAVYGSLLAANSLNMVCLFVSHPELRPDGWTGPVAHMRLVLKTASRYFVLSALDSLSYILDSVLALHLLGAAASAEMAIAQRVSVAALGLLMVAAQPLWPAFVEAAAKGERRWILLALARGTALILSAAVAGSAILVVFGIPLLKFWLKSDVGIDQSTLWVMAIWIVSLSFVRVQMLLLNALRIMKFQIGVFAIATTISLVLKFALAPRYGVAGILVSTAVTFPIIVLPAMLWRIGRWRQKMASTDEWSPS